MAPTLKGFTREYLASLFSYDPETGLITRLVTRGYNARAGDTAGCVNSDSDDYICVKLGGKILRAHRLAYFLHTGEIPKEFALRTMAISRTINSPTFARRPVRRISAISRVCVITLRGSKASATTVRRANSKRA